MALTENGHIGMIKRKLEIEIPSGLSNEQLENIKLAIEAFPVNYEEVRFAHWNTIQSWANEMNNAGEIVPEDIFSVFRSNKTTITV